MSGKKQWKRIAEAYTKFVDGYGFAVIVVVCVTVITGTAVWTGSQQQAPVTVTPPVAEDRSASLLLQESLQSAATPTLLPTSSPEIVWQKPLDEIEVIRTFSTEQMQRSGVTGLWTLHNAVDLRAAKGTQVCAMADGTVLDCGESALEGVWVMTEHAQGYQVYYGGLSMLAAIQPGDRLHAGQTIGFVGSSRLDESDLGAHLHLQAFQDGIAVDPLKLPGVLE